MPTAENRRSKLPGRFTDLSALTRPRAITSDAEHARMIGMIDRLMSLRRLTKDQQSYLETLVQLVQAYEQKHHAIDTTGLSGIDSLRHLLAENDMNASDLARLLDVHPSMGSKILKGERSLTVEHLRKLADRFGVRADCFMD